MADSNALQHAIEHVLERVQAAGAQADVIANRSNNFSLKANAGELDEYKVTSGQQLNQGTVFYITLPKKPKLTDDVLTILNANKPIE